MANYAVETLEARYHCSVSAHLARQIFDDNTVTLKAIMQNVSGPEVNFPAKIWLLGQKSNGSLVVLARSRREVALSSGETMRVRFNLPREQIDGIQNFLLKVDGRAAGKGMIVSPPRSAKAYADVGVSFVDISENSGWHSLVENSGTAPAHNVTVTIYLAPAHVLDANGINFGSVRIGYLAPGDSITVTPNKAYPPGLPTGFFYHVFGVASSDPRDKDRKPNNNVTSLNAWGDVLPAGYWGSQNVDQLRADSFALWPPFYSGPAYALEANDAVVAVIDLPPGTFLVATIPPDTADAIAIVNPTADVVIASQEAVVGEDGLIEIGADEALAEVLADEELGLIFFL